MSAPNSNGRQLTGVANVLSTISGTLWLCAAEANFSKSRTAREGLAIVSPNTALVFGRKAASSSSAVQSGETNVKSMPIFFIVTAKRLYVPPYIAEVIDSLTQLAEVYRSLVGKINPEKDNKNVFDAIVQCDKMAAKSINMLIEHYVLPHIDNLRRVVN